LKLLVETDSKRFAGGGGSTLIFKVDARFDKRREAGRPARVPDFPFENPGRVAVFGIDLEPELGRVHLVESCRIVLVSRNSQARGIFHRNEIRAVNLIKRALPFSHDQRFASVLIMRIPNTE
jgi:hypothetical protein